MAEGSTDYMAYTERGRAAPRPLYGLGMMEPRELLPEADEVLRAILPVALEASGRPGCAERLRSLPALTGPGSVWRAMLVVESVAMERPGLRVSEAARLCGDAAVAALRGEASRFASLVRRASAFLRGPRPGSSLN